jgi:predicted oxidoreductase
VQAQRVRAALDSLAQRHGVGIATLAYAWILRHPSRPIPITGSSRIEGLREAVAAVSLQLPAEDWYRVWQASMGHEVA